MTPIPVFQWPATGEPSTNVLEISQYLLKITFSSTLTQAFSERIEPHYSYLLERKWIMEESVRTHWPHLIYCSRLYQVWTTTNLVTLWTSLFIFTSLKVHFNQFDIFGAHQPQESLSPAFHLQASLIMHEKSFQLIIECPSGSLCYLWSPRSSSKYFFQESSS